MHNADKTTTSAVVKAFCVYRNQYCIIGMDSVGFKGEVSVEFPLTSFDSIIHFHGKFWINLIKVGYLIQTSFSLPYTFLKQIHFTIYKGGLENIRACRAPVCPHAAINAFHTLAKTTLYRLLSMRSVYTWNFEHLNKLGVRATMGSKLAEHSPVSIPYKSIAGRYRPVRVADGPITARYGFIKNANWEICNKHSCF